LPLLLSGGSVDPSAVRHAAAHSVPYLPVLLQVELD
jgi:hypothetical protein